MMAETGSRLTAAETLLAATVDRLSLLVWQNTKDGQKNQNRPPSILSEILSKDEKPQTFDSPEAFEAARQAILRGENNRD